MRDFAQEIGRYDIIVGHGRISLSELASLKRGSVVTMSDRESGDPVDLTFNGEFLAHGMIEVTDGLLMLRLVFNDWQPEPLPRVPVRNDVTETLGCSIRLAHVEGTLADLTDVGEYGLVNFGIAVSEAEPAELIVADRVAAIGAASFTKQSWALLVEEPRVKIESAHEYYSTGAIPIVDAKPARPYDFARPDMFSREQIIKLRNIHELMAQNLSRGDDAFRTQQIDQFTLEDSIKLIHSGGLYRVTTSTAGRMDEEVDQRYFAQLSGAVRRADETLSGEIERYSRKLDSAHGLDDVLVCVSPEAAAECTPERVLSALRNAWKTQVRMPDLKVRHADVKEIVDDRLGRPRMVLYARLATGSDEQAVQVFYPSDYLVKIVRGLRA